MAETFDLTPSEKGYRNLLIEIIRTTPSKEDFEWATMELMKLRGEAKCQQ